MTPREYLLQDISISTSIVSPLLPLSPSSIVLPKSYYGLTEGELIRYLILYPNISINSGTTRLNL